MLCTSTATAAGARPQLQSPASNAVNMQALLRLAWMWQETGHGDSTVGQAHDARRGQRYLHFPERESSTARCPSAARRPRYGCRVGRADHPHACIDSSEHRTDGVYAYKLVLSPCENSKRRQRCGSPHYPLIGRAAMMPRDARERKS